MGRLNISHTNLSSWDARAETPAHLGDFRSQGRWKFYPHIEIIHDAFLDLVFSETNHRLIVTVPPQFGKSELISGYCLQWMLGSFPDTRCALVSHGAVLAKKWGRQARDFIREYGEELFGAKINPTRQAADNWGFLGHRGGLITTGIGGPLVGEPVDFGIIDDFFKNSDAAMSPTMRDKLKDWYQTVFLTRLSRRAKVIIVCTRWHEDDLVGWLLRIAQEGGDPWVTINLPAIAVHPDDIPEEEHKDWFPDPLGRSPGEHLCPSLHMEKILIAQKTSDWFWPVFQGRPTAPRGGMFTDQMIPAWFPEELPVMRAKGDCWEYFGARRFDEVIFSFDARFSRQSTKSGSYVVGQVWGRLGARKLLLDQVRGRWGLEDTILQLKELCRKWPMAGVKLFEDKALGPEIVQRMKGEISGLRTWPCVGDKVQRVQAVSHQIMGSNVYSPQLSWAAWVRGWRKEIITFPKSPANDQIDATSQALSYFQKHENVGSPITLPRSSVLARKA